jgi:hypothetical protein
LGRTKLVNVFEVFEVFPIFAMNRRPRISL